MRALPPEKGAFSREESGRGCRRGGGGGEGTGQGKRCAAWESGGNECSPPLSPTVGWEMTGGKMTRGREVLQPLRDCRQRKSSLPLSRFSFIDTRGFVFQSCRNVSARFAIEKSHFS